jgi:hypothetical protein
MKDRFKDYFTTCQFYPLNRMILLVTRIHLNKTVQEFNKKAARRQLYLYYTIDYWFIAFQ